MNERVPEFPIVLFDGYCNFCDATVQFMMKRDKHGHIRYAPLQSDFARELLKRLGQEQNDLSTAVLIENGELFTKTDVGIRATKYFRFPWPMAQILLIFPKFLRDPFYDLIARNRYKWWGKKSVCKIPSPEERSRFLA